MIYDWVRTPKAIVLNQSQSGMCIWGVARNRAESLAEVPRPLIAGPSGSGDSPHPSGWPARRGIGLTLCCTKNLVPRHWFPVASCLAQPQTASSALKSGL